MNWSLRLDGRILLESIMKGVSSLGRPRQGGMRT
jgi:hypothetical protein